MKPAPFRYHRPTTVEAALELLDELEGAELLAGNQSLGIVMGNRLATPDHLIDINGIDELSTIEVSDTEVVIGALARHQDIERSDDLHRTMPVFPIAAEQIAGPAVRSRGTLGGSLGEADPAGNYPTIAVTLDASIRLVSTNGTRTVRANEFFEGYLLTDIEESELIEGLTIEREPYPSDRTGMAFEELKPAAQTWPTVSAAAVVRVDDPGVTEPAIEAAWIGIGNAAAVPLKVPDAEAAVLDGPLTDDALDGVAAAVGAAADPDDELHADAEFKTEAAAEYARRAVRSAYERAGRP